MIRALRPVLASIAVLALVIGVLAVALAPRIGPPGPDLSTTPAAQVSYPGSVVIKAGETEFSGYDAHMQIVGVDASMDEVLAFHEGALADLGFVDGAGMLGTVGSSELYSCAWHSETEVVRLSFMARDEAIARYPDVAAAGTELRTIYRWLVVDRARHLEPKDCPPLPD